VMEVFDLPFMDYFEHKPETDYFPARWRLFRVRRDTAWWAAHLPILEDRLSLIAAGRRHFREANLIRDEETIQKELEGHAASGNREGATVAAERLEAIKRELDILRRLEPIDEMTTRRVLDIFSRSKRTRGIRLPDRFAAAVFETTEESATEGGSAAAE
jgi:hypothetical protein